MPVSHEHTKRVLTPEQQEIIDYADAALALSGHEISDSFSRNLIERQVAGEITGDEYRQIVRERFMSPTIMEILKRKNDGEITDDQARLMIQTHLNLETFRKHNGK